MDLKWKKSGNGKLDIKNNATIIQRKRQYALNKLNWALNQRTEI